MCILAVLFLLHAVLGTHAEVHKADGENNKYEKSHNFVMPNETFIGNHQLIWVFNNSQFHLDSIIDRFLANASRNLSNHLLHNESAIDAVKLIGELIRAQINGIARDFRLSGDVRTRQQSLITLKNHYSVNLVEHAIREGYLILRYIGEIFKEAYYKATKHVKNYIDSFHRQGYKIMNVDRKNNHMENYENMFDTIEKCIEKIPHIQNCLYSDQRHYDLSAALVKLIERPSADTMSLLKTRLNRPLSKFLRRTKTYEQFDSLFICHIAVNTSREEFEDCVKEIERIKKCLDQWNSNQKSRSRSNDWMRSIKHLDSTCTDKKDNDSFYSINCASESRIPKGVKRQVELIFKDLADFELKRSPMLNNVADDLVKILETSDFGKRACYRLCQLSMIYRTGQNKKSTLQRMMNRNDNAISELGDVSKNLQNFRNGILREMSHFVNRLRKCIRSLESILSKSIKMGLDKSWMEIIKILEWIYMLFDQGITQSHPNNATNQIRQKSSVFNPLNDEFNNLNHYDVMQLGSNNLNSKVSEESFAKFLQGVYNYSGPTWKYQNTTLGSISESLLLGTLLLEGLAYMSSLFYL